ncbi:hypothetical protein [Oceanirhabdus sp. W0125-5]|uniref:hypothetical protein n=1 Tax=Oceanirhabdus sp. W0125-5 TaxID=2999116 RepID=UPI0022F322FE|nr:hypothetical protein [Oceanirhabdus sp. W0125-5]WBW99418.1 hypothetical protein OW730_11935 [Oceanirhabdus sp. W0125-5]
MSDDNKKLFKYLGILFLAVLLTYRLPHDSYSISHYILRPIRHKNSVFHLTGLLPLVTFIIGIKRILSLERFANKSKILIALLIIIVVLPIMEWSLDFTRTNYHWLRRDGLKSVDIVESDINLENFNDELTISFNLKIKDYSRKQNKFKIRVYLPKSLSNNIGNEFYEFENEYRTHGNRSVTTIKEQFVVKLDNYSIQKILFKTKWYWEDVVYELYDEKEVIKNIKHGL